MTFSLVFPAYNEVDSIGSVLESFSRYLDANQIEYEIIVVNDGSHDATAGVVRTFIKTHPAVRLIHHPTNQGYGAALRSGFAAAAGDYIFFTDSDGQFQPDDLDHSLTLIEPRTLVLGYRQQRADGLRRRLNANLWSWLIRKYLGIRIRDLNCAWKIFPRRLIHDTQLVSTGAFINAELLYLANVRGLSFREIPVRHFPRRAGKPTGTKALVILKALQELIWFVQRRHRSAR